MYCSKCGSQNEDDASFCIKCGSSFKPTKPEIERKGITGKLGKMGIPGFRSGKKWKMAIAIFGYFFIFLILLGLIVPSPSPTTQNPQSPTEKSLDKYIYVKHTGYNIDEIGYNAAGTDKIYFVIKLEIENHGYNNVEVGDLNFKLKVNNVIYTSDTATVSFSDYLSRVELADGGKVKGRIAFQIPKDDLIFARNYTLIYQSFIGVMNPNIKWEYIPNEKFDW